MSQKRVKQNRIIMMNLKKRALDEYYALSFWRKLKWRFDKEAFVKHYIKCHKESYFAFWNQFKWRG